MKFVSATREFTTFEKPVAAPLFRKSVVLDDLPQKAEVTVAATGFYELFVNGQRITKGLLAPYICNPDDFVYYDRYDLAPYLKTGENVIGVVLGNGMQSQEGGFIWDFDLATFRSAPKFALESETLGIEATDFVWTPSAILFDDLRCGVVYDARQEHPGWSEPGYDQSGWSAPLIPESPRGDLKECTVEPIRVQSEKKAVAVRRAEIVPFGYTYRTNPQLHRTDYPYSDLDEKNGFLYDFGVNTAGTVRLSLSDAKAGTEISLTFGDELNEDGNLTLDNLRFYPKGYLQRLLYICKDGEQSFTMPFCYFGGRYAYVSGTEGDPDVVTFLESWSDLATLGSFSCSDETTNALYEMADRSDRSNFYYFPTDCPHREKHGWTGDANVSAEHMILHLDTVRSWKEWLGNIRKAQADDGSLPGIVPTTGWGFAWGNGPAYDTVLFTLPYIMYRYRGETDAIRENAHAMLRYLEYIASQMRDENGIVAFGLGDWVPVNAASQAYLSPLGLTGTVMCAEACRRAEVMFSAVGLEHHRAFAAGLRAELIEAARREYLDPATMMVAGNSQTSQALFLHYGIFLPGERKAAFAALMEILERDGFKMTTGFLGTRVLFHVLAEGGEAELAHAMITSREFPGYGKWVEDGETAMLEAFKENTSPGSHNHHFMGDISHWFVRHIAGINVNPRENCPDFVAIKPRFLSSLTHAEASYQTPGGSVAVEWDREEEGIRLTVRCTGSAQCAISLEPGWRFVDQKKRSFLDEPCERELICEF